MEFTDIVAGVLDVGPAEIVDTAGPATLLTWTSLRHLELVVNLEQAYGVSFTYQDIRNLRSIGQVRDVLRAKGVPV